MTTEETELTFVRCPSCRSLVPAVATRCRMCGYSFESGAEASEADEQASSQSKSRVRQRTISASREQLDELAAGGTDTSEAKSVVSTPSLFPPTEVDESTPLDGDPFGSGEFEVADSGARMAVEKDTASESGDSVLESFSAAIMPQATEEAPQQTSSIAVDEPNLFDSSENETFVEPADVEPEVEVEEEEEVVEAQAATEESEPVETVKKKRRRRRKKRGSSRVLDEEVLQKEEKVEMSSKPQRVKSSKPSTDAGESGVLVGWFVSFMDDPKGEAEELRSGKFFIGRQQLRDDDMIIDKDGVSTPHCLVAVASDGSLKVQDLMSENGTLLRRADDDEFEAIGGETVDVEHGDKLRLGSCEFTICLLPSD